MHWRKWWWWWRGRRRKKGSEEDDWNEKEYDGKRGERKIMMMTILIKKKIKKFGNDNDYLSIFMALWLLLFAFEIVNRIIRDIHLQICICFKLYIAFLCDKLI